MIPDQLREIMREDMFSIQWIGVALSLINLISIIFIFKLVGKILDARMLDQANKFFESNMKDLRGKSE